MKSQIYVDTTCSWFEYVHSDDTVIVKFKTTGIDDVNSMQMKLHWDTNFMRFYEIESVTSSIFGFSKWSISTLNIRKGTILILWFDVNEDGESLMANESLFELKYLCDTRIECKLEIENSSELAFMGVNGNIRVLHEVCELTSTINKYGHDKPLLYPNPIKSGGILKISDIESAVSIEIWNLMGEKLNNVLINDLTSLNLKEGIYIIKINVRGGKYILNRLIVN